MSQKKLKKIRKEAVGNQEKQVKDKINGVREILKKNWKFLLILMIGIIVVYFNSLWGNFVSDDYATITQNQNITSLKFAWSDSPASFFVNLYKTIIAKSFGVDSSIPFHIGSLLVYLGVVLLGFIFMSLLFNNLVSKISLIIFAFLPIHVEAVSWISGIPYLLTSVYVLIESICLILFLVNKKKKYIVTMLIVLLISFFSDRIRGFGFVLISGLVLISFKEKLNINLSLWKVFLGILVSFGCLFLLAWPMINNRITAVNSGTNASESNFYNPFFQYPTAIPKYLQLIVFPTDITLYHTMYILPIWLNWSILLTYLTAVVWFWFKNKKIFFALAFIFVATAPSMAPVKVSWLVAERYVFLGSLGVALLLGIYFEKLFLKRKIISIIGLSVLCLIYSVRIFLRNMNWQTNHNLWVNTCQVSPNSHNAWNNIGDDYDKLANNEVSDNAKLTQYYNSIKGFGQSYAVKPNYADAYHNQANIFYKIGRMDLARNTYEKALSFNPNLYQTYLTLMQIDMAEKNESELLRHLAIIQKMKPNDLQVAYISAVVYAQVGKIAEAKQITEIMYKQFPNVAEIKNLYDSLNKSASESALIKQDN